MASGVRVGQKLVQDCLSAPRLKPRWALKTAWQRRWAPVEAQVRKLLPKRRWAPIKAQMGKNYSLKTAWQRRWAVVKAQVGKNCSLRLFGDGAGPQLRSRWAKNCSPKPACWPQRPRREAQTTCICLPDRTRQICQKSKKGAPSARHYTLFLFEYLPHFSARVARSKAIVFQKSRLPRSPFFGGVRFSFSAF